MSFLLLAAVLTPFVAAPLAGPLARWLGARAGLVLALAFAPGIALLTLTDAAKAALPALATLSWVPGIGLELGLRGDGFSLMFALVISGIGILVMLYASAYLGKEERHGRFYTYLLLFGGAMLGLVLADNLVALFAFWELTSVSSFLLIGFWDFRKASQDGALKAFVITAVGGLALLAGVILMSLGGGSIDLSTLDIEALRASSYFWPAVVLLLVAALTKSAQLPFHLWLPTAMEAPTPVSAYLHSATMVKAGVFLVAKFGVLFADTPVMSVILYVGLLTMFWGSYLAIRQSDLKALLAYSTVSQLGLMMALYGAGHAFAATAHLINHAAFKACLFMVVGIIDHETGSRDIDRLSGLRRKLPLTCLLAVPAALSMAGLPPLGGFISKELFYEEMLHDGTLPIFIAVVGSIMTFAYSLRFLKVFFGPYVCAKPNVHEAPPALWLPLVPLSLATVLFGVFPATATWFTNLAAPTFGYGGEYLALWHGFNVALQLSILTWVLGVALHLLRGRFVTLQEALTPGWNANTVYYALVNGLERFSYGVTRLTQGAGFAAHVRLIWLPFAAVGLALGWRYLLPVGALTPVPIEFWVAALLVVSSVTGVLIAKTRLSALIFTGLAGFASTLLFVLLRAPDLALTQLLIETVTVILFLSVFRYLPLLSRYGRSLRAAGFDAVLAGGVGVTLFTLLVAVQTPVGERLKDYFLTVSKTEGGGYNVVNVILVDIRGYDTMGEITVLAVVGVAVYALLKLRASGRNREDEGGE